MTEDRLAFIIFCAVAMTLGYSCMAGRNFSWISQMKMAGLAFKCEN